MLPDRDVRFTQHVYAAGPAFAEANVSSDSSTPCEVPMRQTDYCFTIHPLTAEEGRGYLIEFPDLSGCMSDGETIEEAFANDAETKRSWIAAMQAPGRRR